MRENIHTFKFWLSIKLRMLADWLNADTGPQRIGWGMYHTEDGVKFSKGGCPLYYLPGDYALAYEEPDDSKPVWSKDKDIKYSYRFFNGRKMWIV